jgi:hypothetical protein
MFYVQEVFVTSEIRSFSVSSLIGKCYVSAYREYLKMKPRDIPDSDHFVVESRYNKTSKSFAKAKILPKPAYDVWSVFPINWFTSSDTSRAAREAD